MLVEWRDELLMSMGDLRLSAAEHALERVSAAVEVAGREADVDAVADARMVAQRALDDLRDARRILEREGRIEKDDLAALAELVPEGMRHFGLREAKRRIEQATLRIGFVNDELLSVEGLQVKLRNPYFAMEAFLAGLFEDFHASGLVAETLASVEEAHVYVRLILDAIEGAAAQAATKLEAAQASESEVVGRAVASMRPGPIRVTSRYTSWDAVPLRRS